MTMHQLKIVTSRCMSIFLLLEKVGEYQGLCSPISRIISCNCRKFETIEILCCHILKVFDILDIKMIHDAYILKRWTREAKK